MSGFSVSTVGRAIRHHHWLIWLTALIACALAYGATFVRPPVYEASALLSIDESTSQSQGFDVAMQADQFLAQRFVALGTSRNVLAAVCAKEGPDCDPTALGRQIRVTTPKATAQLQVTADASSPGEAARLANEAADALIAANQTQVTDQLKPQRTLLEAQLKQVSDQMAEVLQQTSGADAAGRPNSAGLQQLTFLQTQYASTYQRLQDLNTQLAARSNVLTVQQRATPPSIPADPDPVRYVLVGLAGGLVAGLLAALLAERLRTRIHHASELAEAVGTDVVVDLSRRGGEGRIVPYRFLARMGRGGSDGRPRTLLLVGSTERDHVDQLGMELAHAVAAGQQRVLVLPAHDAPAVVMAGEDEEPAAGRRDGIDMAIHCSMPPLQDAALDGMRPALDRAVVLGTKGVTKFNEARRTSDLLRAAGVEVAAAVLLPRRMKPDAVPHERRLRIDRAPAAEVAAE